MSLVCLIAPLNVEASLLQLAHQRIHAARAAILARRQAVVAVSDHHQAQCAAAGRVSERTHANMREMMVITGGWQRWHKRMRVKERHGVGGDVDENEKETDQKIWNAKTAWNVRIALKTILTLQNLYN